MRELTDVHESLDHHKPRDGEVEGDIAHLRRVAKNFAVDIDAVSKDPRCTAIAYTKLEECLMWAIKGAVLPALLICGLAGCALDQEVWQSVDTAWSLIEPDYKAYVAADPDLTEEEKTIRVQHAQALSGLLDEAAGERGFTRRPLTPAR